MNEDQMNHFIRSSALFTALTLASAGVASASDSASTENLSLDEILNLSTTIATKTALTTRESPGIISVITGEEIRNSGARDLTDALNLLVPGFGFGHDVEGAVGLGIRGL